MTVLRFLFCTAILAALLGAPVASADVTVWLDPASPTVIVGEATTIDIMADCDDPTVAWGIDLTMERPAYADWLDTTIGPAWDATDTLDLDGLAGLHFPGSVTGEILLATLTFEGVDEGVMPLVRSSGPEDDEGFLLESGLLATNVEFLPGSLTVIPEPGGLALLILGALTIRLRQR